MGEIAGRLVRLSGRRWSSSKGGVDVKWALD